MSPAARKRARLSLCLLAIIMAVGLGPVLSKPKLYRGKTVGEWVSLLDMHVDRRQQRDEASAALTYIGAAALPELERILAWRPSYLERVRNWAVRFGLAKPRAISPLELQSRACEAAYNLAERVNVDISRLEPHLEYHFTGTYAESNSGRALAAAGPMGIAFLTNALFNPGRRIRDNAAAALRFARTKPEVIEALIRSANSDPDSVLRANAIVYLTGSRASAQQLVPLGIKFLQSDDSYARSKGALLLRDYVAQPEARTALENASSDPDERVRLAVQRALESGAAKTPSRK